MCEFDVEPGWHRIQPGFNRLKGLTILVRDDGEGIPEDVLHLGWDGHFGLQGMHERADRIDAFR